ncbi:hypothetical protein PHLGIDRAFT_236603 [Phlebiopsis gigantea 11061_1 CR5-6]|uniref:Uncharacterized protein n=1 Tax=Phlebiopsis gigantea (strain 11061_1 CR5-6) TaxID=745531 RepID=A0A0C3S207_PHLG1|nr:hypothetical protein PHLGIDRAFT_236603 [Phlebiopsis gigantea 11061_1 CR5-6]
MAALAVPPPPGTATTLVTLQTLVAYFNWGLFGVLSAQVYLFHDASQGHPWDSRKMAVYTIYTLQIAQTALITFAGFKYLVEGGLGNVQPGNDPKLGYIAVPIISGIDCPRSELRSGC